MKIWNIINGKVILNYFSLLAQYLYNIVNTSSISAAGVNDINLNNKNKKLFYIF